MTRRPVIAAITALSVSLATALLGSQGAAAADPPGAPPEVLAAAQSAKRLAAAAPAEAKIDDALDAASGTVTALVEFTADAGVDVAQAGGSAAAVQSAAAETEQVAEAVVPQELSSANARSAAPKRIATLTNLVSGSLVTGDAAALRALADNASVVSVRRVLPRTTTNSNAVPFTNTLAAWQNTGRTGAGVTIGVIDTGLDYTHADFGGPGTAEAYAEAYGTDGTGPIPDGLYDPEKFLGGVDLAGQLYDADPASEGYSPVPVPDANPIDATEEVGGGHGTHVAGTAAGYGVAADGTTFDGDYSALTDVDDFVVGPGTAPEAGLYSIKVFGDNGGSTEITSLAFDWAADPNGDGDFSDHLDVLNLSLGADYGPVDEVDSLLVTQLSALGTVVVMSAGNNGDLEDTSGSPGTSSAGIGVASSVADPYVFDAVEVTEASDPSLVGTFPGQYSIAYPIDGADVTAPVAYLGATFDGCTPFTPEEAAAVAGKVAYLWWDDDDATRACGSIARFTNAAAAGAVGVLLPTELPVFSAGISGIAAIPGLQLTADATDALLPQIEAGTLTVHLGPSLLLAFEVEQGLGDTISSFSSRGTHGSLGAIKPDVAAPGSGIVSARTGGGTSAAQMSGTSMASPHTAGIVALIREAHPGWSVAQVKAALLNTATHDIWTGAEQSGDAYGPSRVGSGRVDGLAAVTTDVIAYNSADPSATSVSFGIVDVGATPVEIKKTVTVQNTGTTQRVFATSVSSATTAGGATITASPASITVPAGGTALVTLTLSADPATLARDIDPTMETEQLGLPREYVAQVSGRLVLTSGDTELRVAVAAAPRLVSELTAGPVAFADAGALEASLPITGRGVASGGWFSLTTPLVLAAESPKLETDPTDLQSPSTRASADIRYVGWSSDAPAIAAAGGDPADATLGIGVAVDGNWSTLGTGVVYLIADIDVDQDGTFDLETYTTKLTGTDVTVAYTVDYESGDLLDAQFVNGLDGTVETGVFDSSVVVMPINLANAGIEAGATPSVEVYTLNFLSGLATPLQDSVEPFTVDPYAPPFWFESNLELPGVLASLGIGGEDLAVHRAAGVTSGSLLVLQHQNGDPVSRAQVVDVTVPAAVATTTTLSGTPAKFAGQRFWMTATVSPDAAGTVAFVDGDTTLATVPVTNGTARTRVLAQAGDHAVRAVFTPSSGAFTGSESAPVAFTVAKSPSTLKATPQRATVVLGEHALIDLEARGTYIGAVHGWVKVTEGSQTLAYARLSSDGSVGRATISLPRRLGVGTHTVTITYQGTPNLAGSSTTATFTVVPRTAPTGGSQVG